MFYLLLGLALGTFVSGLIATFYPRQSGWVPSGYLYALSGLLVLISILVG